MNKPVTRQELARRLGRRPRAISRWLEEGCPVERRGCGGKASLFNEAAVRAWLAEREGAAREAAPNYLAAKTRQANAMAAEAEQRLATRAGKLIPIDDIERALSSLIAATRAYLLNMIVALPDRICRVAATDGAAGIEALLQKEIYHALEELASGDVLAKLGKRKPAAKASAKRPKQRKRVAKKPGAGSRRAT